MGWICISMVDWATLRPILELLLVLALALKCKFSIGSSKLIMQAKLEVSKHQYIEEMLHNPLGLSAYIKTTILITQKYCLNFMRYTSVHGVHYIEMHNITHYIYIDSKNLKKFAFSALATALLCDYLEKIHVWMFTNSEDVGVSPHVTRKPTSDPHYFLTNYFRLVASETNLASNLTISRSVPMNLLHKWGLSKS